MESYLQQGMEPIRPLTWDEAFEFWRISEGSDPDWLAVAKERGFDSWEEWRRSYVAPFKLDARTWGLYRIADPIRTVPRFRGGPFQGWIERTYGSAGRMPTFEVIAAKLFESGNGRASSLKASFPPSTTVLGVMTKKGVVIIEGMHRCSAIAMAAADGTPIKTDLSIALGSYLPGDLEMLKKVYKNPQTSRG